MVTVSWCGPDLRPIYHIHAKLGIEGMRLIEIMMIADVGVSKNASPDIDAQQEGSYYKDAHKKDTQLVETAIPR